MSSFHNALSQGYSPEDILAYIAKAIPQSSSMIKKAMKAGHPAQQILGFLSKSFDNEDRTGLSESERHGVNRRSDTERVKYGLKVGASALALPIAGIAARSALSRSLPSQIQDMLPGVVNQAVQNVSPSQSQGGSALAPMSQQSPQIAQSVNPSSQSPLSPNVEDNIPQTTQPVQPQVNTTNISNIINNHGLTKHIDELSKNVKDPKAIAAILYNKFPKEMKKFQEEVGKPMEEAIADYMQSNVKPLDNQPNPEQKKPLSREEALGKFRDKLIESAGEKTTPEPVKIEKGATVASPQGIGEIQAIRNGKAIVEVDGKKHQVNEDELIQSPIPEKDLADLYEDLIGGIEKSTGKQVSRNVEWAGYDPNTNELAYKPHGSDKMWSYDDIPPEDVEVLTSLLTQRKSTGENFIGAWQAGTESPIGAAMYQLIKKLQAARGGKGNEYKNKYETIYDALEPAKKAAKERHAERKKKAKKPRFD